MVLLPSYSSNLQYLCSKYCFSDISIAWTIAAYDDLAATVGTNIIFTWSGSHDVQLMPDQNAFDNCDFTESEVLTFTSESSHVYTIPNTAAGDTLFFACGVRTHCSNGQKASVFLNNLKKCDLSFKSS